MDDKAKATTTDDLFPSESHEDRVWTTSDVAEFLHISERLVQGLAKVHQIPHTRIGRLLRFSEASVRKWFEEQQTGGEQLRGPALTERWWKEDAPKVRKRGGFRGY